MPSNSTILSLAPGAGYLAANALDKGQLFHKNKLNPLLPQQIYALYFIIKKVYDKDASYPGMTNACIYLWEIMGRFGLASQGLSGGGGSVTPVTPPTTLVQLNFTVAASGTTLIDGQSSVMLDGTLGNPDFRGFNLLVNKNGTPLAQIITAPVYYVWSKVSGLLTVVPAAFLGDEFQITAV